MSPETNWFSTSRGSDLEVIGPILGYFLRIKAESFCRILSPKWNPIDNFDEVDNILSICDKAVKPVVVELSVAERTVKQLEKFVHISSANLDAIKVDKVSNEKSSRKIIMHDILPEYHSWAWSCLNTGNVVALGVNVSAVSTLPTFNDDNIFENAAESASIPLQISMKKTRSGRTIKARKFFD